MDIDLFWLLHYKNTFHILPSIFGLVLVEIS